MLGVPCYGVWTNILSRGGGAGKEKIEIFLLVVPSRYMETEDNYNVSA